MNLWQCKFNQSPDMAKLLHIVLPCNKGFSINTVTIRIKIKHPNLCHFLVYSIAMITYYLASLYNTFSFTHAYYPQKSSNFDYLLSVNVS